MTEKKHKLCQTRTKTVTGICSDDSNTRLPFDGVEKKQSFVLVA